MSLKKRVSKSIAIALAGITLATPIFNTVSAMETSYEDTLISINEYVPTDIKERSSKVKYEYVYSGNYKYYNTSYLTESDIKRSQTLIGNIIAVSGFIAGRIPISGSDVVGLIVGLIAGNANIKEAKVVYERKTRKKYEVSLLTGKKRLMETRIYQREKVYTKEGKSSSWKYKATKERNFLMK